MTGRERGERFGPELWESFIMTPRENVFQTGTRSEGKTFWLRTHGTEFPKDDRMFKRP